MPKFLSYTRRCNLANAPTKKSSLSRLYETSLRGSRATCHEQMFLIMRLNFCVAVIKNIVLFFFSFTLGRYGDFYRLDLSLFLIFYTQTALNFCRVYFRSFLF